ncbi:MAG: FHA domain-containing protein [Deltaproteobacteria bacterium]|nr:FHA domain-containing protein [Deltaproteobacteria bacterium]
MTENLIANILQDLKTKSLAHFQMKYTGWYLLGGPAQADDSDISYKTDVLSPSELNKLVAQTQRMLPFEPLQSGSELEMLSHFLFEIRKKPTNAFSGWISVGRAVNNDIVLRYPTISKLHARFEVETTAFGDPIGYRLIDNNSTGKTAINGVVLTENQAVPVSIGDSILFGNIRCSVTDASLLWESLR